MITAYIYPTPEALRRARQPKPTLTQEMIDDFVDSFFTRNGEKTMVDLKCKDSLDLPDDGNDLDPMAIHDDFEERLALANARADLERAALKALNSKRKKALKARKKFKGKWVTHKGDVLKLPDMPTMHLFYAARMIWNHSVPDYAQFEQFNGEPMKQYPDVDEWPVSYRRDAWIALIGELAQRSWNDLPSEAYSQFKGMQALSRHLNFK